MSLLTIIQNVIAETGYGTIPTSVIGNSDALVKQCLALANRAGNVIARAHLWKGLITQTSFQTQAGIDFYALSYDHFYIFGIVPGSIFQSTGAVGDDYGETSSKDLKPIIGSMTAQQWNAIRNVSVAAGSQVNFRLVSGKPENLSQVCILLSPIPDTTGIQYTFEMHSAYWVNIGGAGTFNRFVADSNSNNAFSEDLITQSVIWRLKKAKGFDYTEEFNEYQTSLSLEIARDVPAQILNFGTNQVSSTPASLPYSIAYP